MENRVRSKGRRERGREVEDNDGEVATQRTKATQSQTASKSSKTLKISSAYINATVCRSLEKLTSNTVNRISTITIKP